MAKTKEAAQVYQLKITLRDVKPPVWRRVQVKDGTLAKLHDVILIQVIARLIQRNLQFCLNECQNTIFVHRGDRRRSSRDKRHNRHLGG